MDEGAYRRLRFNTHQEGVLTGHGDVHAAQGGGIRDEVCRHINVHPRVPRGYWDVKENVATEALKWTGRDSLSVVPKVFKAAKIWLVFKDAAFTHRRGYWNYERCAAAANTPIELFNQNELGACKATQTGMARRICHTELWTREWLRLSVPSQYGSEPVNGICENDINSRTKRVATTTALWSYFLLVRRCENGWG